MGGRQHADLGGDGSQVGDATAVDAHAIFDDALAHQLLGQLEDGVLDLPLASGELARRLGGAAQLDDGGVAGGGDGGVAILLDRDRDRLGQIVSGDALDSGEHVGAEVDDRVERQRLDRAVGGNDRGDELTLELNRLLDPRLGGVEAGGQNRLVDLLGALGVIGEALLGATGLDHHDRHVAVLELTPGNDELEHRGVGLGERRVGCPLAVRGEGDADGAERAFERDAADHQGGGRRVDRQHVVRIVLVGADDRGDDLRFIAEAVGERRAQRTVGEPAREDGVLGGTAFATEERAGDLAGGVRPLLDVDRQRKEVDARTQVMGGVRRRQHGRATDRGDDGALALWCQLAGFERERLIGPGYGTADADGISH